MTSTQPIKTRGNVLIRKRGRLSASSVQCRDLECHGIIEANVTCSGDATFRIMFKDEIGIVEAGLRPH